MRILFVTHSYPRTPGDAAGSFVHRLACALTELGESVQVLAPAAAGLAEEDTLEGVPVRRYRYAPRAWETLAYDGTMAEQVKRSWSGKLAFGGMLVGGALAVRRMRDEWRPDVVHAHWWFPAGLQCAWTTRAAPLVTTMHGSDLRLAAAAPRSHAAFRAVMRRSKRVSVVSRWLASQAQAMAPGLAVEVAPMPVDVTRFHPGTERHASRLLFVGRLNAQKGIAQLLEALAASTGGASLDVIGEGEDRQALQARTATLGLAERVTFHGALPQPQLVPYYQRASAVVMPSELEGLGLVAVEAQLCETPVIAWASGGLVDVVADGVSGTLLPPGDSPALTRAIDDVVARPEHARELGRTGRSRMLRDFAPAAVAATYQRLYREAIGDAV